MRSGDSETTRILVSLELVFWISLLFVRSGRRRREESSGLD
jgi:hypothetical protein